MSNGNPQIEDGYIKIANEFWEALCHVRIPGEARQVLDVIIRKTWGFSKKSDCISLSQFEILTGLSKVHIIRARKTLEAMGIIITQKGNGNIVSYSIVKHYDNWKALPKKVILPKKEICITKEGNLPLPKKVHTKDNITKDNITKETFKHEIFSDPLKDLPRLSEFYSKLCVMIREAHPKAKIPTEQSPEWYKWRGELEKLYRIDKYQDGVIIQNLTWCFESNNRDAMFWKDVIRSVMSVREKCKDGSSKFEHVHEKFESNLKGGGSNSDGGRDRDRYGKPIYRDSNGEVVEIF